MAVAYQAHGSFMITSKLLVHDEYVRNCSQFSTDASSMHVLDKDIKNSVTILNRNGVLLKTKIQHQ